MKYLDQRSVRKGRVVAGLKSRIVVCGLSLAFGLALQQSVSAKEVEAPFTQLRLIKLLVALNQDAADTETPSTIEDYLHWAQKYNVITSAKDFNPNKPLTSQSYAEMMVNFHGITAEKGREIAALESLGKPVPKIGQGGDVDEDELSVTLDGFGMQSRVPYGIAKKCSPIAGQKPKKDKWYEKHCTPPPPPPVHPGQGHGNGNGNGKGNKGN